MIPEAEVKKRNFSLIWLIPVAALITGIWIIYHHYSEKGINISIEFKNGNGITEGKTAIKYAGIKIGTVDKIKLSNDFSSVIVNAVIEKQYSHFAKKNSLFWLVKPRLEVGAISGVETIFSGQYIAVRPGQGEKNFSFKALEDPPPSAENAPGLHLVLKSKTFSGLVPGSPVLFKKIRVGKVESYVLSDQGDEVLINILISPEYSKLVKKDTRFWNVSGFEVSGDLSGIKIKADSFASVLDGGIAFDTHLSGKKNNSAAENKDEFILYDNKENAMERGFEIIITFETGEGLIPNSTPLKYKGITIGKVTKIDIDQETGKINATIRLKENAINAATENSKFWMVKPRLDLKGISGLSTIISGQYIEVQPGNGKPMDKFQALSEPPFTDPDSPGLHLILQTKSKGSLSEGSPVYTRGIEAGRVEGYELSKNCVNISVHIYEKYSDLIFSDTRFWNQSGIKIKGGLSGIDIQTGNFQSFIAGSIAFDTPFDKRQKAKSGDFFKLYPDMESANTTEKKINILFEDSNHLKKGTTLLKYKGIEIGKVTDVKYTDNMEKIAAEVSLFPNAPDISKKGSVFFMVKPQIDSGGIKGLETIISGSYINTFIGNGTYQTEFEALKTPPAVHQDMKGKKIIIKASKNNFLKPATPVYYGSIEAGMITKTRLAENNENIDMEALIYDDFKNLVSSKTRFFNISGIDLKADLFEVNLKSKNISAIITGGIGFDNIENDLEKSDKIIFSLYDSKEKAMEKGFFIYLNLKDAFGIKENFTKIIYKGLTIGRIEKINFNEKNTYFKAKAFIKKEAENLIKESSQFYLRSAEFDLSGVKYPETLVSGKFIELIEGKGEFKDNFFVYDKKQIQGLEIILESSHLGSLSIGKPLLYRQIKIGEITDFKLKDTFDKVLIYAVIDEKYKTIVRENTKFWYTGGIATKINLLGVKIKTGTLESILKGGIAIATPDKIGSEVQDKTVFKLHDKPEEKWLEWTPLIQKN
jgi:paraquat-inducible protein B